jgi:hypothetical protein
MQIMPVDYYPVHVSVMQIMALLIIVMQIMSLWIITCVCDGDNGPVDYYMYLL